MRASTTLKIGHNASRRALPLIAHHGDCREQAFGGDVIDQRADGNLQRHGGERPDCQDQPNVQLRPILRRQIGGDKRSPSGLDVGEEKCKPVEPALAPTRALVLFVFQGHSAVHFFKNVCFG